MTQPKPPPDTAWLKSTDDSARVRRVVTVPVYWIVVGFVVMVVSPILSIMVSAKINQRTIAETEAAKQEARQVAVVRYCRLFGAQADVFDEASSPVGRAARDVWLTEYRLAGCKPPK